MYEKRNETDSIIEYILAFVILFGFLYPRGLQEISNSWHTFFQLWTWGAVILIIFEYVLNNGIKVIRIEKSEIPIWLYFILAIVISLFNRGSLTSGLQQLFAFPFLCVYVMSNIKKRPKVILNTIINICIVTFSLNIIIPKSLFLGRTHITFLGHVQMICQIGILAIMCSVIYWMLYKRSKLRVAYLIIVAVVVMLTTDASSAILTASLLVFSFIIYRWRLYHILQWKSNTYIIIGILLSLFIIYLTAINNLFSSIIPVLDFSGRSFVWKDALQKITLHPLTGYGIDGVLLKTFWLQWSDSDGFNYAHNQIVQNMLDGGIVLTLAFWNMISAFLNRSNYIREKGVRVLCNAVLIALLIVMVFDSTTLYCYMFVILSICYALPELLEDENGNTHENKI